MAEKLLDLDGRVPPLVGISPSSDSFSFFFLLIGGGLPILNHCLLVDFSIVCISLSLSFSLSRFFIAFPSLPARAFKINHTHHPLVNPLLLRP
jgi:hypothetical protein